MSPKPIFMSSHPSPSPAPTPSGPFLLSGFTCLEHFLSMEPMQCVLCLVSLTKHSIFKVHHTVASVTASLLFLAV